MYMLRRKVKNNIFAEKKSKDHATAIIRQLDAKTP